MGLGQQLAGLSPPSRLLLGPAEPAEGRRLAVPLANGTPDGQ